MAIQNFNPEGKYSKASTLTNKEYLSGIRKGDRSILSRAITLIESDNPKHKKQSNQLISLCLPHSGESFRLGITGVPGVGKSTFIEAFGSMLIKNKYKVAVLAIDPSSAKSKGSILGDKTRMAVLSSNENAFIRPSPAVDTLGGVAQKTRESIVLCEAAGYDFIIVETVGVGQSEIAVKSMVDFFLLLLLPGAGDELQGIKRGIVEMADMLVINKADGELKKISKRAKLDYKNALHLFPPTDSGWDVPVLTCSSVEKAGLDHIQELLEDFQNKMIKSGFLKAEREKQNEYWLTESLFDALKSDFLSNKKVEDHLDRLKKKVTSGKLSPFKAAEELIDLYKQNN
ncbi:MAG: methylmalonyl Co-A mutase-associated GTPase MeaB [Bacteroidetes bacterium]|nr:MAG: methylmalonyl Co-A mutase-associated GTPase MeaB [Bacteroidota bacterium]